MLFSMVLSNIGCFASEIYAAHATNKYVVFSAYESLPFGVACLVKGGRARAKPFAPCAHGRAMVSKVCDSTWPLVISFAWALQTVQLKRFNKKWHV